MRPSSGRARRLGSGITRRLDEFRQDLRSAVRRTKRGRLLAVAVVLTIGLGLGAATAIFTALEAALLDPLPYAAPERLVHAWESRRSAEERSPTSYATLLDWRERATSFAVLEGYNPMNVAVGTDDEARMLRGGQVTTGFFRLLGVSMSAGRDFLRSEEAASDDGVVVVSDRFARSGAGGSAVGRTITINRAPYVVIGVLPREFHFAPLQDVDVWVPLVPDEQVREDRSQRGISVVGRLADGVTPPAARTELSLVMTELASEHPEAMAGRTAVVMPLRDALLGNVKAIVLGLFVAVALLLVAMATNLALLMLTRNVERASELSVRSALGASRARLLRQMFVESLALAGLGGALAVVIGHLATRGLLQGIPEGVRIDLPYFASAGLDASGIAFIAGVSLLLAIGFGLGPAVLATARAGRVDGARVTGGPGQRRLREALVVAQLAVTVVLLIAGGLLVGSFRNLIGRDVGLAEPEMLVAARVSLSGPRYQEPIAQQRFYEDLLARVSALAGVGAAAAVSEEPGGGGRITTFDRTDRPRPPAARPQAALRIVAGDYFSTAGIPLLEGRTLDERDRADGSPAAVVSADLARILSENGSALGRRIQLAVTGDTEWEVVGIIGDVQIAALDAESPPAVYVSHLQVAENRMSLVLRTGLDPGQLAADLRALVRSFDPAVPVYAVATLQQKMHESRAVFSRRFPMLLIGAFAVAALALALVALYAMVAHDVLTRRRELAIRLALGATPPELRRGVLGRGVVLGIAGVAAGTLLAIGASRSLAGLLFGMSPVEWRVYGAVAIGVLGLALCATLQPALRAAAVNPGALMREE